MIMRTRQQRRSFTKRYQERQRRYYEGYNARVWDRGYEVEEWRYGQWKTRSWKSCGTAGCCMCCNQRRNKWAPARDRLTFPERKAYDAYLSGMEDAGLSHSKPVDTTLE